MRTLKKTVSGQLKLISAIMILLILLLFFGLDMMYEHMTAKQDSEAMFVRIEQLLEDNEKELEKIEKEYSETCLRDAKAIAYMIQQNPYILENIEEMRKIAGLVGVDEIHIFDSTGKIFTGTHPEYFNYTFDSGTQIGFFKPMLNDKTLQMVQEITPNTAEGKLVQYSAVWSDNEQFIVQVGMEPINVLKITEKNRLSYVFNLLRVNVGVDFYAVDKDNGEVVGSTNSDDVGKSVTSIGMDIGKIKRGKDGFHATVNGIYSYCVFTEIGDNYIGRIVASEELHPRVYTRMFETATGIIGIVIIMVIAVSWCINKFVIDDIYKINNKLRIIADGNLDEEVNVNSSVEFSELSAHINNMKKEVLASTDKISYVLDRINMNIGVYEYNDKMNNVRYTKYVPKLLGVDVETANKLASDCKLFNDFIQRIRKTPVPGHGNIFKMNGSVERYVKLEEVSVENNTLGIVIDATEEYKALKRIETERDIDELTGLFNRRGMERKLAGLFNVPEKLGYGALVMIDADGLKEVNDKHGHEMGDAYLKKITAAIKKIGAVKYIAARQGGDEFVMFIYGFGNERDVLDCLDRLKFFQNNTTVKLSSHLEVPLRFSMGYSLVKGQRDYKALIQQADARMYSNKRSRKGVRRK